MKRTLLSLLVGLAFCLPAAAQTSFINEIHYDNDNGGTGGPGDLGEAVEVVTPTGTVVTGWVIVRYNGSNGTSYGTDALGTVVATSGTKDIYVINYPKDGLQNGAPDGLALVDGDGSVIQFLSYEGSFMATDGPANGLTSTNIGVSEPGSTPVGESLQLSGSGASYTDFVWQTPAANTFGAVNNGQSFGGVGAPESASVSFSPTSATTPENMAYTDGTFVYTLFNSDGDDSNNPAASGTVSVTSGADQIQSFTTSYSFDAGTTSGSTQPFSATPVDDGDFTGDRDAVFELAATTEAASGTLTLTITDDEAAPVPDFVINEIHADPDAAEGDANGDGDPNTGDDEFVELVNTSNSAINISGYVLSDAVGARHTFTSGTVVPAGGSVVVFGGGMPTGAFGNAIVVTASSGTLGLNNGGDTVRLATSDDVTVVTVTYGNAGNNQSLARNPDLTGAFVDHTTIASNPVRFSPGVRNDDGTAFGTAPRTVTQPARDMAGYVLLSAPVLNYTVGDLAGLNLVQGVPAGTVDTQQQYPTAEDNVFPIYNPATTSANDDTYLGPPSVDYVLVPGEGFFWYLFDNDLDPDDNSFGGGTSESFELSDFSFSATGSVYQSDVSVTLDNNLNGFYMIGNPFADVFAVSTTSLTYGGDGTLQNDIQTYDQVDGYQTISLSAGGTLDTWEGAFAEIDGGTTNATFSYDFDAAGGAAARTASGTQARLALILQGDLASGMSVRDLAAQIEFREEGTSGWDRYDASKLVPPSAEFALLAPVGVRNGTDYRQAVLSVGEMPQGTLDVPFAFRTTTAGSFTITPEGLDAMPSGTVATLIDRVAGTSLTLVEGQSLSFNAEAGEWAERFTLEFARASTAGETGPEAVSIGLVAPNPTSDAARLTVRLGTAEHVTATVFDALGRQVAVAFDGDVTSEETVSLPSGLAPGLYVVRVQGETFSESRQFVVTR